MKPYGYKYRPAYGSKHLLIEFEWGISCEKILPVLLETLAGINFRVVSEEDLWMNDKIMWRIESDAGKFSLSRDTWGGLFLEARDNQEGLEKVHLILEKSRCFQSEKVDFSEYKLKGDRPLEPFANSTLKKYEHLFIPDLIFQNNVLP